jgi:hypothetical protein
MMRGDAGVCERSIRCEASLPTSTTLLGSPSLSLVDKIFTKRTLTLCVIVVVVVVSVCINDSFDRRISIAGSMHACLTLLLR